MKTREHSDLYLTYDSYKNVLHATRSSNGTDGFLRYLHDDAEHIIREGHNPNVWVSYVHFHDGGDGPDLREAGRHGFFDRVLDNTASEAQKNAVIANAAYAIRTFDTKRPIATCVALARETVESGRARATFRKFIELNS